MKTIVRYMNGESYEYLDYTVDGWVDWDEGVLRLVCDTETVSKPKTVYITPDTLCIEVRDPACSYYSTWTNPKYDMSVNIDVMTAKARSKANRSDILSVVGSTMKGLKEYDVYDLVRQTNEHIKKFGIEYEVEHFHSVSDISVLTDVVEENL